MVCVSSKRSRGPSYKAELFAGRSLTKSMEDDLRWSLEDCAMINVSDRACMEVVVWIEPQLSSGFTDFMC